MLLMEMNSGQPESEPLSSENRALIKRYRLLDMVRSSPARIVVITGPPGYGKTALLDQLHGESRHAVRFECAETGSDALSFLAGIHRGINGNSREPGRGPGRHSSSFHRLISQLAAITNHLEGLGEDAPALFFDDFHEINCHEDIIYALDRLLSYLPAKCRCFLAGREKPALRLGRLAALGQVLEITGRDLEFTPGETYLLTRELELGGIDDEDINSWVAATGGWPWAIAISAQSVQRNGKNPADNVARMVAPGGSIYNYIEREVWSRLDPDTGLLLEQCSMLDTLDVTVIDAACPEVLVGNSCASSLREAADRGLLVWQGDSGFRYQLHPLFRKYLEFRLCSRSGRQDLDALHHRFALACEESGDVDGAIRHHAACGSYGEAERLIISGTMDSRDAGKAESLQRRLSLLPPAVRHKSRRLLLLEALLLEEQGRDDESLATLVAAERDQHGADREYRYECSLARARFLLGRQDDESLRAAREALSLARGSDEEAAAKAAVLDAQLSLGRTREAFELAADADTPGDAAAFQLSRLSVYYARGDFRAVISAADRGPGETFRLPAGPLDRDALLLACLSAGALIHAAKYQEALSLIINLLEQREAGGDLGQVLELLYGWAQAYGSREREGVARLKRIGEGAAAGSIFMAVDTGSNYLGSYLRRRGQPEKAALLHERLLNETGGASVNPVAKASACFNLAAARLKLATNEKDPLFRQGLADLLKAHRLAKRHDYLYTLNRVNFYRAWAALALGYEVTTLEVMKECLDWAARNAHHHFVYQELVATPELLKLCFADRSCRDRLVRLSASIGPKAIDLFSPFLESTDEGTKLNALGAVADTGGPDSLPLIYDLLKDESERVRVAAERTAGRLQSRIEDLKQLLSRREIEVLDCMVAGASNAKIATRLAVTEPTVKSHVMSIFRKLGVTKRSDAMAIYRSQAEGGYKCK